MLKMLIGGANSQADYSQYVAWDTVKITKQLNMPSQLTFTLRANGALFDVPAPRSYVKVVAAGKYAKKTATGVTPRSLFTGLISAQPQATYVGIAPNAMPKFGGQQFEYAITCTSDEYLINLKAIPFIPAFVNRSQGDILSTLADVLCSGYFDTTGVASGDLVPYYNYDPTQSWSQVAKTFADSSRRRYEVLDKKITYVPYGDEQFGITYDEEVQTQSQFYAKALNTSILQVPPVNDVMIVGDVEAGNSRDDYFLGDGFTGNFVLRHKVFEGASTLLLHDAWSDTSLDNQQWYLEDPGSNFDFSAGALNIISSGGADKTLGTSYLMMNNGLELAGGINVQHGELVINAASRGVVGGLYSDSTASSGVCLGGFLLASPGPVTTTASGAIGVYIQPIWGGQVIGDPIISQQNHSYVLQTIITAPKYTRYDQLYRTREGEEYGGSSNQTLGDVTLTIQDYDIQAATGFFYEPETTQYLVQKTALPPTVVYALANNQHLNVTISNTTIALMPLGALEANVGPSGLTSPTGLILPMLPPGHGGYQGPVQPWAGSALSGDILLEPGELQGWQQCVLGNGFELQTAQITQGNEADTLAFFAQTVPAAGTPIHLRSWEAQAAVSRLQDPVSIAQEQFIVGDDGLRSAIVTTLSPLPRTSEDCDNAAQAYLKDRVGGVFYSGTYTCTDLFFTGVDGDATYFPACGRFLSINSPQRQIINQKYLVTGVTTTVLSAVDEVLNFQISFGADLNLEKVLRNFVDTKPANVLSATDKANPPNPRYTTAIDNAFLPDLLNIQATDITDTHVDFQLLDIATAPVEVRQKDTNWGRGATSDYVGTFTGNAFLLARYGYEQTWYMRFVQDGVISRRSKVVRVAYPLRPEKPNFVSVLDNVIQLDFNGDNRNIYGVELRHVDGRILVQRPVSSFASLNFNLLKTPLTADELADPATLKIHAYFFNAQWRYSPALFLGDHLMPEDEDATDDTVQPVLPWNPAAETPVISDVYTQNQSFALEVDYVPDIDQKNVPEVTVSGYLPVNVVSVVTAPDVSEITVTPIAGGTLTVGKKTVQVQGYDAYGKSTVRSSFLVVVNGNGFNSFSVKDIVWGEGTVGYRMLISGEDGVLGVVANFKTIAPPFLITVSSQPRATLGATDDRAYAVHIQGFVVQHSGPWALQTTGLVGNVLTLPGGTVFADDKFKGYVLEQMALSDGIYLPITHGEILTHSGSSYTVKDVRGWVVASGDLFLCRSKWSAVTANSFRDINIKNEMYPDGLDLQDENGIRAIVIAGGTIQQVQTVNARLSTNDGYVIDDEFNPPITVDSQILLAYPTAVYDFTAAPYVATNDVPVTKIPAVATIPVQNYAGELLLLQVFIESVDKELTLVGTPARMIYISGKESTALGTVTIDKVTIIDATTFIDDYTADVDVVLRYMLPVTNGDLARGVHGWLQAPDTAFAPTYQVDVTPVDGGAALAGTDIDLGKQRILAVDDNGYITVGFRTPQPPPTTKQSWRVALAVYGDDYEETYVAANNLDSTPSIVFDVIPDAGYAVGEEYAPCVRGLIVDSVDSRSAPGALIVDTISVSTRAAQNGYEYQVTIEWRDPTAETDPDRYDQFDGVNVLYNSYATLPTAGLAPNYILGSLEDAETQTTASVYRVAKGVQRWVSEWSPVPPTSEARTGNVISIGTNGKANTYSSILTPRFRYDTPDLDQLRKGGGTGTGPVQTQPLGDASDFFVTADYKYDSAGGFDFIMTPLFTASDDNTVAYYGYVIERPVDSGFFVLIGFVRLGDGSDSDLQYFTNPAFFPQTQETWKAWLISYDVNDNPKYTDVENLAAIDEAGGTPAFGTSPFCTFDVSPQASEDDTADKYAELVLAPNGGDDTDPIAGTVVDGVIYYPPIPEGGDGTTLFGFRGAWTNPDGPRMQSLQPVVRFTGCPDDGSQDRALSTVSKEPPYFKDPGTWPAGAATGVLYFVSVDASGRANPIVNGETPGVAFAVSALGTGGLNATRIDGATLGNDLYKDSSGKPNVYQVDMSKALAASLGNDLGKVGGKVDVTQVDFRKVLATYLSGDFTASSSAGLGIAYTDLAKAKNGSYSTEFGVTSGVFQQNQVNMSKVLVSTLQSGILGLVSGQLAVTGVDFSKGLGSTYNNTDLVISGGKLLIGNVDLRKILAGTISSELSASVTAGLGVNSFSAAKITAYTTSSYYTFAGVLAASVGYFGTVNASNVNAGAFLGCSLTLNLNGVTTAITNAGNGFGSYGITLTQASPSAQASLVPQLLYFSQGSYSAAFGLSSTGGLLLQGNGYYIGLDVFNGGLIIRYSTATNPSVAITPNGITVTNSSGVSRTL